MIKLEEFKNLWVFCVVCFVGVLPNALSQVDTFSLQYQSDTLVVSDRSLNNQFRLKNNAIYVSREARELAATFDDPSRVLYRHPGISTANDQANGIIYHGMPSDLVKWSIHGAEIVNPNHLSNAGTLTDISSPSSGGVLAIPFDVINNFSFHANANTENLPSAISGVSNFDFKSQSENFFKIGLLGLEYALQTKGEKPAKLHLRYSTVGLLSNLGLDFGGEKIVFTDLFFQDQLSEKLDFVAGLGYSSNTPIEDYISEDPPSIRDFQEVDYNSFLAYVALVYSDKKYKQSLVYSQKLEERNCFSTFSSDCPNNDTNNLRVSYAGEFNLFTLDNYHFDVLVNAGLLYSKVDFVNISDEYYIDGYDGVLFPALRYRWYNNEYSLKLKIGPMLDFLREEITLEPSLSLIRQFSNSSLQLSASSNTQTLDPVLLAANSSASRRSRVSNISLSYKKEIGENIKIMSKVFFHHYLLGYVSDFGYSPFFNGNDYSYLLASSFPDANGRNLGFELFYDHQLGKNLYFNTNITLFDFTYTHNGIDYDAANNYKYIFNASMSKKIKLSKDRSLLANLAFHYRGGATQYLFHRDFDFIGPDFQNPLIFKLSDYYRLDARIQYSFKKSILSLDIQNLTNRRNEAFYFYDSLLQETTLRNQLGIIPVLSWKRKLSFQK